MWSRTLWTQTFLIGVLLSAGSQPASAYDKPVPWSGRYSGLANANASWVQGGEALYFNPSGLSGTPGTELVLNFSPTVMQFNAPVSQPGQTLSSSRAIIPMGSALVSTSLSESLALGVGAYVAGGTSSDYGEVNFGLPSSAPIRTSIQSIETSLGLSYQLAPGLKLGGAWRVSFLSGDIFSKAGAGATSVSSQISGLSGTDFLGYRLGAQYAPPLGNWGVGLSFRSPVSWNLKNGSHVIQSLATNPRSQVPGASSSDATLETSLPYQISLGTHLRVSEPWLIAFQYEFTEYHSDETLVVTSSALKAIGITSGTSATPLEWKNLNTLRLGTEYTGLGRTSLRLGYAFTTALTPDDHALYPFSAPGVAHIFNVGAGYQFREGLNLDGGIEYGAASGTVTSSTTSLPGNYRTDGFAVHLGFRYGISSQ